MHKNNDKSKPQTIAKGVCRLKLQPTLSTQVDIFLTMAPKHLLHGTQVVGLVAILCRVRCLVS